MADCGVYRTIDGRTALDIAREVCGNAAATIAVGACAWDEGLVAASPNRGCGRAVCANQLYLVKSYDPLSLLIAIAVLSKAAMIASFIPARRAACIDPM